MKNLYEKGTDKSGFGGGADAVDGINRVRLCRHIAKHTSLLGRTSFSANESD